MKVKNKKSFGFSRGGNALIFFLIISVERSRFNWCTRVALLNEH